MQRLHPSSSGELNAVVQQPQYDRSQLRAGIVHLGLGAFHRAHQAVYTDDAIAHSGGDWGIIGVSLRSAEVAQQLLPQDGLYSVMSEDAMHSQIRVIAAIQDVLVATEQLADVIAAIARQDIKLVTLTITEKGYTVANKQSLDRQDPAVQADLANPAQPRTAVGILALGLQQRMLAGGAPLTVMSCDNLSANSTVLRAVLVGLLGVSARDGLPEDLRVNVDAPAVQAAPMVRDPWNYWVFQLGGQASLQSEESNREEAWEVEVTADRVTDEWRISFGGQIDTQTETFNLDEEDEEPFKVVRRERRADWFLAKALGSHWSLGLDGDAESSTFGNVKFRIEMLPAIEFNVFPYEQYASRQLRFEYGLGVQHARYNEVTLFGRLRETRPRHELSVTLDQREPWGTLQSSVEWSQYLHDLRRSRLEFEGEVNLRIIRGLALEIEGQASRIRDQLSLPRRGATPEEVLLRVRELQSGHDVRLSVGVTYSFGSIFNNIVNPRFGRN